MKNEGWGGQGSTDAGVKTYSSTAAPPLALRSLRDASRRASVPSTLETRRLRRVIVKGEKEDKGLERSRKWKQLIALMITY